MDLQKYEEHFAGGIASRLLKQMFPDVYPNIKVSDTFHFQMYGRLEHGRGGPKMETILKELASRGIITPYYEKRDVNSNWRGKPEYRWFMNVVEDWFYSYCDANAVKPVFEIKGLVEKKEFDWSSTTKIAAASERDSYRKLSDLSPKEAIYVRDHMKEFSFEVATQKQEYRDKRYGTRTHTEQYIVLFPYELMEDTSKTVFKAHAEEYLGKHFETAVKLMFGIDDFILNSSTNLQIPHSPAEFKNVEDWGLEKIQKRLNRLRHAIEYFERVERSLLKVEKALSEYKGDFYQDALKKFHEYMEQNFPCHLVDDDEDLKKIAEWMFQGKNQGLAFDNAGQVVA